MTVHVQWPGFRVVPAVLVVGVNPLFPVSVPP
jgi:hypothetical protein